MRTFLWLFAGLLMLAAGCVIGYIGVQRYMEAGASADWPRASGEVLDVRLKEEIRSEGRRVKRDVTYYMPHVFYGYDVNGRRYQSDQIRIGSGPISSKSRADMQQLIDDVTAAPFTVAYDPADPDRSTLQVGVHSTNYIMLLLGVGLLVVGGGLTFVFGRRMLGR